MSKPPQIQKFLFIVAIIIFHVIDTLYTTSGLTKSKIYGMMSKIMFQKFPVHFEAEYDSSYSPFTNKDKNHLSQLSITIDSIEEEAESPYLASSINMLSYLLAFPFKVVYSKDKQEYLSKTSLARKVYLNIYLHIKWNIHKLKILFNF